MTDENKQMLKVVQIQIFDNCLTLSFLQLGKASIKKKRFLSGIARIT